MTDKYVTHVTPQVHKPSVFSTVVYILREIFEDIITLTKVAVAYTALFAGFVLCLTLLGKLISYMQGPLGPGPLTDLLSLFALIIMCAFAYGGCKR
jgi:hypothetical protein